MSTTKNLKDVFKDAQEVTSLASTDRLMVKDANGNLKCIGRTAFNSNSASVNSNSAQWVRLFSINGSGALCFDVSTNYNTATPSFYLVQMLFDSVDSCIMKVVSSIHMGESRALTKFRLVKEGSLCYIDAFYSVSSLNSIRVSIYPSFREVIPIMTVNPELSGQALYKEFLLSNIGGG